jgi:hypothetical protein
LEGWGVRETQLSKAIEARGELRARRRSVLVVIQCRLGTPVPEPIRLVIEGSNDMEVLGRWLVAALTAASWTDFEAAMQQGPPS